MRDWHDVVRPLVQSAGLRPEDEADVIEELVDHANDRYAELCARGMTEAAAAAAVQADLEAEDNFGRDVKRGRRTGRSHDTALGNAAPTWYRGIAGDVRVAFRLLRRNPVFSLAAILTIGLTIGANSALYSSLRSLLLRPLPYPDPSALVFVELVSERQDEARSDTLMNWSWPKFAALQKEPREFASLAAYATQDVTLQEREGAERVTIEMATSPYFSMLGIRATAGRLYGKAEDLAAANSRVVVLSSAMWRERYASDGGVLGRTLSVNGSPYTIIGVASEDFRGLDGLASMWVPMSAAPDLVYPEALTEAGNHWFGVIGRLRPGVAAAAVAASMREVYHHVSEQGPAGAGAGTIAAVPLDARRASPVMRTTLIVLFGAAMMTLLIACANIASLLVARGAGRQQELSVRLALGAGRWRVVRQLLAESMVIAFAGGIFGVVLGVFGDTLVRNITPALAGDTMKGLLAVDPSRFDTSVLLFTLAAIIFTGIATGIAPAFRASRTNLTESLREGTRGSGHSRAATRTRSLLIVVEAALAVTLLVGAGLLLRTFTHYRAIDSGIDTDHVLTWRVALPDNDKRSAESLSTLYADILQRVAAIPDVVAVTADRCLPLSAACPSTVALSAGEKTFPLDAAPEVDLHMVMPGHLDVLHLPLRRGRMFTDADRGTSPRVVLLSESAARSLFGSEDPIGRTISLATAFLKGGARAEVVGVVGDARYGALTDAPAPAVYGPVLQFAGRSTYMMARTRSRPELLAPLVRNAMRDAAPGIPVLRVLTLEEHLASLLARTRVLALLLSAFAVFAFVLAVIGVFGVIASAAEQRRGEIGIRIALGASPSRVANVVAASGFAWFAAGVCIGVPASLVAARLLRGLLYGIAPTDGLTFGVVIIGILVAGAAASFIPARRAASLDPADALRSG